MHFLKIFEISININDSYITKWNHILEYLSSGNILNVFKWNEKKTHSIYTRSRFSWEFAYQSAENGSVCMRQLGKRSSTRSFHKIFFQTQIVKKKKMGLLFRVTYHKAPHASPLLPFSNKWIENNSKLCRAETSGTKGYRNK